VLSVPSSIPPEVTPDGWGYRMLAA
jgi:hypothetical protein